MRQEQETTDVIGAALRRTYRPPGRTEQRFEDLLRRLAEQEASALKD